MSAALINPPIEEVDIPFNSYTVLAEKGDTLVHPTGTVIVFPANSFTDEKGNLITGEVDIQYREFKDVVDFFLSGIPMKYQEPGQTNEALFESAGMCEVVAYKGSELLKVNQAVKPMVHMSSNNAEPKFNVYYLDTILKKWIEKQEEELTILDVKDIPAVLSAESNMELDEEMPSDESSFLFEPVKANPDLPGFEIEIDPASVPELMAYNGLIFELHESDTSYNIADTEQDYRDVEIEKGISVGIYNIKFVSDSKSVSYLTRPVFEGKNYDEALKLFKTKQKQYDSLLEKRL